MDRMACLQGHWFSVDYIDTAYAFGLYRNEVCSGQRSALYRS
jgi:hypothetical protein